MAEPNETQPTATQQKKKLPTWVLVLSPLWFPFFALWWVHRFLYRMGWLGWTYLLAVDSAMSIYIYKACVGAVKLNEASLFKMPNWVWLLIGGLAMVILMVMITLNATRRRDVVRRK